MSIVAETEQIANRQKSVFEIKSAMFLRTGETALRRAQNKFALLNQYVTTAQYNRMGVTDTNGGNSVVSAAILPSFRSDSHSR